MGKRTAANMLGEKEDFEVTTGSHTAKRPKLDTVVDTVEPVKQSSVEPCLIPSKPRKKVHFSTIKLYQFPRQQDFFNTTKSGRPSMSMDMKHSCVQVYTVEEFTEQQKPRAKHVPLQRTNKRSLLLPAKLFQPTESNLSMLCSKRTQLKNAKGEEDVDAFLIRHSDILPDNGNNEDFDDILINDNDMFFDSPVKHDDNEDFDDLLIRDSDLLFDSGACHEDEDNLDMLMKSSAFGKNRGRNE